MAEMAGALLLALTFLTCVSSIADAQDRPIIETTVFARAIQPGEVVRLDVRCACRDDRPVVSAFGTDVPLFPIDRDGHWRGLIGIDLDVQPGVYPISVVWDRPDGTPATSTRTLEVITKRFAVRRLRVAGRFVDPPASALARIEREAALLESLFSTVGPRLWDLPFRLPVPQRPVSNFGSRSVFNGKPRNPHGGVDFGSPTGTPVVAPSAGRVAVAEPLYFTGNTVILDHGQGLYSLFAHLSKLSVARDDLVSRGAPVGLVGATGRVTGPHLHWTVRLHGVRVDPLSLIAAVAERP